MIALPNPAEEIERAMLIPARPRRPFRKPTPRAVRWLRRIAAVGLGLLLVLAVLGLRG